MGKTWKQKKRPSGDPISDFKWSSQSYSLKEILNNFKLPIVVQCREDTQSEQLDESFFDLRQPILLFSRRNARKIFARCVRKGQGGTFKELLPEVVIPEDYAGWFKISKGLSFTKPSPHHTIQSVYESSSEFFLCTTGFKVIMLSSCSDGVSDNDSAATRQVVEGEVLRKTGVHTVNQMMLPDSERTSGVGNRYLMCIDEKDGEVLIPLTQSGLFYEVSDGSVEKGNCVLQIRDILDEMLELPVYVRHVLGDPPPVSKFYSPCLKLDRVMEEETVMGATLDKNDLMPLEIQTSSEIKFEIALNTNKMQSSQDYMESLDLCDTVAQFYVTDMKLAVNYVKTSLEDDQTEPSGGHDNRSFIPDDTEVPTSIPNSQRTSISAGHSEIGEVDANSEFNIQWDPGPGTSYEVVRSKRSSLPDPDTDSQSINSLDPDGVIKFNHIVGGRLHLFDKSASPSVGLWQKKHFSDTELYESASLAGQSSNALVLDYRRGLGKPVASSDDTLTLSRRGDIGTVEEMAIKPDSPELDDDKKDSRSHSANPDIVYFSKTDSNSRTSLHDENPPQYDGMDLSSPENTPRRKKDKLNVYKRNFKTMLPTRVFHGKTGIFLHQNTCQLPDNSESQMSEGDESDISSLGSGSSDDSVRHMTDSQDTLTEEGNAYSGINLGEMSIENASNDNTKIHQEQEWRTFCFERSASLPVAGRTKPLVDNSEKHSLSWEQISSRKNVLTDKVSEKTKRDLSKSIDKLNVEFSSDGDKINLISETSSDESIHSYALPLSLSGSEIDVYDSEAERKATSLLASANETVLYFDGVDVDADVEENERRMALQVAQAMQIKHEIKRKKYNDWNDECSEI